MRRANTTSRRALRSFGRRAFALVLLLILALFSQSSSLAEVLESAGECAVAEQIGDECSECPLEREGQSCPPACPQCHCGHAGLALPTAAQTRIARAGSELVRWSAASARVVSAPLLAGPFRPPSAAL